MDGNNQVMNSMNIPIFISDGYNNTSATLTANRNIVIGVLALQGCVTPHKFHIESLGARYKEVRTAADLHDIHGLILPGGESTTMLKLIKEFNLEDDLRKTFARIPVWGICAGAILMAKTVLSPAQRSFGILDVTIERNGYGSQLASFNAVIHNSPVCFIRAPIIQQIGCKVSVKAQYSQSSEPTATIQTPVWVQEGHHMATTFHPELATDKPSTIHKYFIDTIVNLM